MPGQDPKQNNPWQKPGEQGPPDLIELIKKYFRKGPSNNRMPPLKDHFWRYAGIVVIAIIFLWFLTGIFIVSPVEEAVVLRFGKYIATLGPGPHWIPRFISSEQTLNVQEVRHFSYQAEMLTKDENIVLVSLAVQYRINDPRNFLFNVLDPIRTLQQTTSSALRQVVGEMTLNDVLTTGREALRANVNLQLNNILKVYQTGLEVTDVTLQPAKPPEAVTAAFDDAIKAREDEQRYINRANAYARRVESTAQGEVARLLQSANAYQQEVVLQAQGQVARYLALLQPYEQAPQITRERLYLDTLSAVLASTTNIVVDPSVNNVMYLPIDQIAKRTWQATVTQKTEVPATDSDAHKTLPDAANTTTTKDDSDYGEERPSYSISTKEQDS